LGLALFGCAAPSRIHVFTRPESTASAQPVVDTLRREGFSVEEQVISMPKGLLRSTLRADDGYQSDLCITYLDELIAAALGEPFGGDNAGWDGRGDYPPGDIALYWLESGSAKSLARDANQLLSFAQEVSLGQHCH